MQVQEDNPQLSALRTGLSGLRARLLAIRKFIQSRNHHGAIVDDEDDAQLIDIFSYPWVS